MVEVKGMTERSEIVVFFVFDVIVVGDLKGVSVDAG